MPRRLSNLLLGSLVVGLVGSGSLGWTLPDAQSWLLWDAHRGFGAALLLLLVWKQAVARGSLRRRLGRPRWDRTLVPGLSGALLLLGALALGLGWTLQLLSFDAFWGYSALNVHVMLGLALVPLLVWHVRRRGSRRPTARELLARRNTLRLIGLGAASLVAWRSLEAVAATHSGPGSRRQTGSKHAGSFSGNAYPETIWLLDRVPAADPDAWWVEFAGRLAEPGSLALADLAALPRAELDAVLDCTGGWWSEQRWTGWRLGDVLAARGLAADARVVQVASVTGHAWTFPLEELRDALLATHVGGEPLSAAHGAPLRLVAPGRRGFQWIKWVARLRVD